MNRKIQRRLIVVGTVSVVVIGFLFFWLQDSEQKVRLPNGRTLSLVNAVSGASRETNKPLASFFFKNRSAKLRWISV